MKTLLGLSGSLRTQSINTALLRTLGESLPEGVELQIYDYGDVPLFNSDLEPIPSSVVALQQAIGAADGVVIATPEYNHSIPGVLKNALDWASRPAYQSVFRDQSCALLSASPGPVGGARAQQHLKTVLLGMGANVFPWQELAVGRAGKLVADGRIRDERTERHLRAFAEGFTAWVG